MNTGAFVRTARKVWRIIGSFVRTAVKPCSTTSVGSARLALPSSAAMIRHTFRQVCAVSSEPSSGLRTFLGPTGRSAYMRRVLTDFRAYRSSAWAYRRVRLHEAAAYMRHVLTDFRAYRPVGLHEAYPLRADRHPTEFGPYSAAALLCAFWTGVREGLTDARTGEDR